MYNYNLSLKKLKESLRKIHRDGKETKWLKTYHEEIQPKLLEHYDARVNAFIKKVMVWSSQIEEKP